MIAQPESSLRSPQQFPKAPHAVPSAAPPANLFAAPGQFHEVRGPVSYAAGFDGLDRVVEVSSNWDVYGPPEHPRDEVLGRALGRTIADESTRECFRLLFERVRAQRRAARMVTRCDHWSFARALEVVFQPGPDRSLTVIWSLLDESQAREIAPEPRRHFEGCELVRLCSWCRAVHMRTQWQPLEVAASALGLLDRAVLPAITHGICPDCCEKMTRESERIAAETGAHGGR